MAIRNFNFSTNGANNKIALKTLKVQWNEHIFIKCSDSLTFTWLLFSNLTLIMPMKAKKIFSPKLQSAGVWFCLYESNIPTLTELNTKITGCEPRCKISRGK